ncbi:MAG: MBL fold metallo-hydrolase [Desulfovibrio sp.]|nr:MBL fold metallo-hydrolase [Desulfovibrio sp.]
MYELVQAASRSFYIQSPAKIGVVLGEGNEVALIDSGSDKDAGKKVKKILDAQGWKLKAIFNTHSHADHIGGNRYLQTQTGCSIYASGIECAFTRDPLLEPAFLYGGNPPRDLRHKFLMAQDSEVQPLVPEALPPGWELVPLPGHAFDMAGFRTPDGAVYLADCLASQATLEKYQVAFLVDVEAYLATLDKVKGMQAEILIPAHADACRDIAPLAEFNIAKVHETASRIVDICGTPASFEQVLKRLFDAFGLAMTWEQHVLVGSTVRSYLAWLKDKGELKAEFKENMLLWYR